MATTGPFILDVQCTGQAQPSGQAQAASEHLDARLEAAVGVSMMKDGGLNGYSDGRRMRPW